jgi:hypothetical protein
MYYKENIESYLKQIGGENVQNTNEGGQEMIVFNYTINSKEFNIAIFHTQIFASLPNAYSAPDLEFYRIIEKLNLNSMLGCLVFTEKGEDYFISYKSNFIGDHSDKSARDIELFITTSLQMISVNHSELNLV